jgi:acyl-CoA synthetase (AMP-forming)/AMP-acid ligase II
LSPLLSELVADGAERTRFVFGSLGAPVATGRLVDAGIGHFTADADADRVAVLLTNDRPTVEVVLGAITAGSVLVSLPLPGRGADVEAYASFVKDVCASHQIAEIVVADGYADLLEGLGVPVRRHSELGNRPLALAAAGQFQLVQFTSGSTGTPKPVVVDDVLLGANVAAILAVLQPQPGDAVVSWLPLAHDMGLVGMLLAGLVGGGSRWAGRGDIVLLDPTTFLRNPASWLEALDHWAGSFTAAPDFAFRLAARRPPATELDLSHLRCAIVGGEVVRAETLQTFVSALRQHGLRERALCPAYGMAEACLAVTMTSPEQDWRTRSVSMAALADGQVSEPRRDDDALVLVSSGQPLPSYEVTCPSPDSGTGTIAVRGPSIGIDGATGQGFADAAGWYAPGDTGFVDGGWLYVCGRSDDYIVAHGRNVYAPAVEAAISGVGGVRPGRVTAVDLHTGEWAVVVEPAGHEVPGTTQAETLSRSIRRAAVGVSSAKPDVVVIVAPGGLPLTSSGKLQRNLVRTRLVSGELPVLLRS